MAIDLKSTYGLNGSGVGCVVHIPTLTMPSTTNEYDNGAIGQDLIVGNHYKVTIDNFQYVKGDQKGFTIIEYNYDTYEGGNVWNITSEPGPVTLDIPSLNYPDLLIYNGLMGDTAGNSMSFTNIRVFAVENIGGNLLPNSGGVYYSNYLKSSDNTTITYQLSGNTSYPELKVISSNSGTWGIYYNTSNALGYYDNRIIKAGSIYNVSFQIWTDTAITNIMSPFLELAPTTYGLDLSIIPQVWKNCWIVAKPSVSGNVVFYVKSNVASTFYIRNIRITECTENDTYWMGWIPSYDSHEQNTKLPDIYETSSLLDLHNRPRDTYHFQDCKLSSPLTKISWPQGGDMKSGIQVLENSTSSENYRYSSYFTISANTNYQVSFWAKRSSNLISADLYILPDNISNEGFNNINSIPVNTKWQFFRYNFTSPSGWASPVRLRFDNNGTTTSSTSSLWFRGVNITTDNDTSNSLKDWEGYKYQIATYIDTSTSEWVYDGITKTRQVYNRANILWSDSSSSGWINFGSTTETETATLQRLSASITSSNMPTSGTGANSGVWVKANGGVCTVTITGHYTFNDGTAITRDDSTNCTYTYTSNGFGTWDSSTRTMTMPSAGTTITSESYTAIVYVSYNGASINTLNFGRQANAVTSTTTPTGGSLTVANIPASGGTISSGTIGGTVSQQRTFTSGATDTYSIATPTGGSFNSVTASNLGSTVKSATVVGTLTYTYTLNGKTGTISASVSQAGNYVTKIEAAVNNTSTSTVHFYYPNQPISVSGGTLTAVGNGKGILTFSSGSVVTDTSLTGNKYGGTIAYSRSYSMPATDGFTLNTSTGAITAANRTTVEGAVRTSGVITSTLTITFTYPASMGSTTVTGTLNGTQTVSQAANSRSLTSIRLAPYRPDNTWSEWSTISAGGGYITFYKYVTYTYTTTDTKEELYTTGDRSGITVSNASGWIENWVNGGYYISSRGTSVGNARSGTLYWTYNGLTSNTLTFTQLANAATSIYSKVFSLNTTSVGANGGNIQYWDIYYSLNYTSGAHTPTNSLVLSGNSCTKSVTGIPSYSWSGTILQIHTKGTTASGVSNGTVTLSGKTAEGFNISHSQAITQAANSATSVGKVSLSYSPSRIDYTGGSSYPSLSVSVTSTYTSGQSKSRTLSSSEYSVTYGGAANSYGTITASRNTGAERSFTATVTVTSSANA